MEENAHTNKSEDAKPPTPEQSSIQRAVVTERRNAMVDAVAGSGKTTTLHCVAQGMESERPGQNTLILTYSRRLKDDAEEKLSPFENAHVHTFHTLAGAMYLASGTACNDDVIMLRIVESDAAPLPETPFYALLSIDEVQDMTPLYFRFVAKVLRDQARRGGPRPQLLILGDCQQAIYGFQGADSRFLSLAPSIWADAGHLVSTADDWARLTLHRTFRVPASTTALVNLVSHGREMVSLKRGMPKPRLVLCETFNYVVMVRQIERALKHYAPEDIFILAPSVRGSEDSPVTKLANMITIILGTPLCVTSSDNEVLSPAVMRGKMVMTTFHQVKGLERPAVIVLGMDATYFDYFDVDCEDKSLLPNTNYVALTRGLESLTIIQSHKNAPLPCFVNAGGALFDVCEVVQPHNTTDFVSGEEPLTAFPELPPPRQKKADPLNKKGKELTDSLRFLPTETKMEQMKKLTVTVEREAGKPLAVRDTTDSTAVAPDDGKGATKEGVAEITGTAIPFDFQLRQGIPLDADSAANYMDAADDEEDEGAGQLEQPTEQREEQQAEQAEQAEQPDTPLRMPTRRLLQCTTSYCANRSALKYKKSQIQAYNWLPEETRETAYQRMCALELGPETVYEAPMRLALSHGPHAGSVVTGRADAVVPSTGTVYEFKFTGMLTSEHVIQLACYMHMYCKQQDKLADFVARGVLYNIRTDEMWRVEADARTLDTVWSAIYGPRPELVRLPDEEFVAAARVVLGAAL